jgi:hypothetical protein
MNSYSYTAEDRIKMAGHLRQLATEMTHGDPRTASMLLVAAKMIERQPRPILPADPQRDVLMALAGEPLLLAASDEQELRRRYAAMREALSKWLK